MKRTPLNRKTPLDRKPPARSQSDSREEKPKPQPKPPRKSRRKPRPAGEAAAEALARELVYARSQGVCEIQMPDRCFGRATDFHHRQNRGRDKVGQWLASNGLHLCRACHDAVTNTNGRRAEYVRKGWIVGRGKDPAEEPVVIWPTGLVYLKDDGDVRKPLPDEIPDIDSF